MAKLTVKAGKDYEELLDEEIREAAAQDDTPSADWQAISHKRCTRQRQHHNAILPQCSCKCAEIGKPKAQKFSILEELQYSTYTLFPHNTIRIGSSRLRYGTRTTINIATLPRATHRAQQSLDSRPDGRPQGLHHNDHCDQLMSSAGLSAELIPTSFHPQSCRGERREVMSPSQEPPLTNIDAGDQRTQMLESLVKNEQELAQGDIANVDTDTMN